MRKCLVSIIFPVHNGGVHPAACLASIAKLNFDQSKLEVIVVDNHTTDGSLQGLSDILPQVNIISLTTNVGFTKAINIGARQAKGKFIFIANDDVRFDKESLSILVTCFKQNPDVGAVGGAIFSLTAPRILTSYGYVMNWWTGQVRPAITTQELNQPDWIPGCALLTRVKLFKKVGGFDQDYEHFFEDADFCLRLKKIGYNIVTIPTARFLHGESTTANKNLPDKYSKWYKAKVRYVIKNLPLINIFSVGVCLLVSIPYRIITLDSRVVGLLKGLEWNIFNLPNTLKIRYA